MADGLPREVVINVEADHKILHGKRRGTIQNKVYLQLWLGCSFQGKFKIFYYFAGHESFQVVSEARQMVGETEMILNMKSWW